MQNLIILLLIKAIVAAIFGFGSTAAATDIAVILFWIFLALFVITPSIIGFKTLAVQVAYE